MGEVLIFSDMHVHAHKKSNDRLQDGIDVLEWVFATAIARKIRHVFFGGDLFHDRTKIDILTMFRVYEVFERHFKSDRPFDLYLLLGNHDMWHRDKWDVHSPAFLRQFPGVHVIDRPCSLAVDDHTVDFLPYTVNPIDDLENLRRLMPRGKSGRRMLLSHLAVHGAKLNCFAEADVVVEHDGDMVKMEKEYLQGWDKVYLGHYHGAQFLGDHGEVEYIGSPYELTKSEAYQEKHLIVHDLDTFAQEYVVNTFSPRHLVIGIDQAVREPNLGKNFVTVVVPPGTSQAEIIEVRHKIISEHQVGSLVVQHGKAPKDDDQSRQQVSDARAILETQDKMLEQYIQSRSDAERSSFDLGRLMKIGMQIIETASVDDLDADVIRNNMVEDASR